MLDEIVYSKTILEMIRDPLANESYGCGWLCDIQAHRVETAHDISKVGTRTGGFKTGELEAAVNTPARNQLIVRKYEQLGHNLPFLAFCVDVAHAEDLAEAFRAAGRGEVYAYSYKTPKAPRKALLAAYRDGEIEGLTSVDAVGEGADLPRATVGLDARPTLSSTTFRQHTGWGRGVAGDPQFESPGRRLNEPGPAGAEQADGGLGDP